MWSQAASPKQRCGLQQQSLIEAAEQHVTQGTLNCFTAQNRSTRKWSGILGNRRTNLTLSHILSPFLFLSPSHNQLSWLMYAHSCPNHWSPDMTKAYTEGGGSTSGSVTGRSIGLSGEERRQTVTFFYPKFTTLCFHVDVNKRVYFYCEESSLCSQIPLQHKHMDPASIVSILTEAVQHVNNFHGFTGKQQRLAVNRMDLGRAGIFFQCSVAPCRNVLFQSPWRGRQRFLLLQDKA